MFSFEKYKHLQEIPPQKVCEIPTLKFLECDPFFFWVPEPKHSQIVNSEVWTK